MSFFVLIVSTVVAVVVSFALTPLTIPLARRVGAVDQPSDRKVHRVPVPRLGGLAVLAAAVTAVSLQALITPSASRFLGVVEFWLAVAVGLAPIVVISLLDDARSVPALPKLITHCIGASFAVMLGIRLSPEIALFGSPVTIGWLAIPLSVLWLVGVTNSFNLVDGLDGLSAGLAFIAAVSLGAVSVVARRPEMAIASSILAGSLAGFLPFNVHPARVFLGDTGATAIGFTLGALALRGGSTLSAGMAILVPVLVVGLPLAETVVSMMRRSIRHLESEKSGVMEADRNHFHHRLIGMGLTHRQAVLMLYGAGLMFAACAIASLFLTYRNSAILLVVFVIAAFVGLHKLGYDEFALIRRGTVLKAYEAPVLRSTLFVVFVDLLLCVTALYVSFVLKYDDLAIRANRNLAVQMLPIVVALTTATLLAFRIYRTSWRSASIEDLVRPLLAVIAAGATSYFVGQALNPLPAPASLYVLHTLILTTLILGSRASYRMLKQWNRHAALHGETVLIYGAGVGGSMALREALSNPDLGLRPVGFIDDDPHLRDRFVNGLPVLGSFLNLSELLVSSGAAGVIIASDKLSSSRVEEVRTVCESSGRWLRHFSIRVASSVEWQVAAGLSGSPRIPIARSVTSPNGGVAGSTAPLSTRTTS